MQAVNNERGSVLVFATLMIVILLIMVGLGLDTGQLAYVRNQGQAAVDAAALAAVSGLPSRIAAQVENRAKGFNSTNDYVEIKTNPIGAANVSYVQYDYLTNTITKYGADIADTKTNGVRVALEAATNNSGITTPVFLTPLLNLLGVTTAGTKDVDVSAVATIQTRPAIPIALWTGVCNGSSQVNDVKIQMQHPTKDALNPAGENACWTTFFDCSSGAPDVKAGFETAGSCSGKSINGTLALGSAICQNKGQVNTVLKTAEKFFSDNGWPNTWWIIPVIGGGGNCDPNNPTLITDWAKIRPKSIVDTGNPKYIVADVVCNQNLDDLTSSLCFSHRLVREKVKHM